MNSRINIIGCGRAASSLARLWAGTACVSIGSILNRTSASTRRAVESLGAGKAADALAEMEAADIWLIGSSDDQIAAIAAQLGASAHPLDGVLVFHLAGRFGLGVLEPLKARGALLAALHPVRSLTHAALSLEDFAGTACVAQGPQESLDALRPLVTSIGGTWLPVNRIERGLYHASVAIISNITKAVAWKAQKWQERAGLPAATAATVTHELLNSTMEDLFRSGARKSITGPVVRGDTSTIEAHLAALKSAYPEDVDVYRILARTVLELAQERGDLDEQTLQRFQDLFNA